MYEAMRTHAPDSTKIAGASVTGLVLAVAAYGLSTGLGVRIVKAIAPPMVVVNLPDAAARPEPVDKFVEHNNATLPVPPPVTSRDTFTTDDDPPIKVGPGPDVIGPVRPGAGVGPVGPRIAPTAPKLLRAEQPPYPSADVRGRNEGVSGLELCVDAKGRVTTARLTSSSGHARLDAAAVQWVRSARFSPATIDGAPQAVCGHAIDYEWKLVDAR
jgi:periplasmic protein TonB